MNKLLKIRELRIDDTDETGVVAISLVDYPAIEENFMYFAANKKYIYKVEDITKEDLDQKYKWILNHEGELENEVCPACIEWSNQAPKTLRTWITTALPRVPVGTVILDMTATGAHEPFNTFCEANCRCHLEAVNEKVEKFEVEFKIEDEEKHEIIGTVLVSGKMIYRHNIGDGTPGYVWFSKDTVRNAFKKFGYNRKVTFQHVQDRTGSLIMMKAWLDETKEDIRWKVKYKVIDNNLWKMIKEGVVKGFSLEGAFK
jgi:hypothetical protein